MKNIKKEFIKALRKMPMKIQTEFLSVIMDKYETIDYNRVSLEDLSREFKIICERRLEQINPFIQSIEQNFKLLIKKKLNIF